MFAGHETDISRVSFYLDDPAMSGSPIQSEGMHPYDFAGTNRDNSAAAFDTTQLADGTHTITALIGLSSGGSETVGASFTVANPQ